MTSYEKEDADNKDVEFDLQEELERFRRDRRKGKVKTKKCTGCGQHRPVDRFYKKDHYCRRCRLGGKGPHGNRH